MRHGLNLKEIVRTSRLVSALTGYSVQPNKAVVGASAFAHESGIHQHGVLANRATYEIMDPVEIGLEGNQIVLGKHSGRHAFADALEKVGISVDPDHMQAGVRALQGARRPEDPDHGPGPRGDRLRGGRQREGGSSRPRVPRLGRRHAPLADGDRAAPRGRRGDRGVGDGRRDDRRGVRRDPARRRRRGQADHVQRVVGHGRFGRVRRRRRPARDRRASGDRPRRRDRRGRGERAGLPRGDQRAASVGGVGTRRSARP